MKQVVSDEKTIQIHVVLSWLASIGILWYLYSAGIAWNYSGLIGALELVLWMFVAMFVGMSVVGLGMWILNLLFFFIQVKRHGSPVEELYEDH